ncbi:hypothetical protein K040078D81_38880 [Blautia hominis]|uniref:ABC transporter permease n=1 Tax=Blautia hominis TaxID=2025493 RepID=A0ABQ0BE80_9FIRM
MREEWKRQMCRPLFWGILIGSILLNMWILANFGGQRELVRKSREIWDELQLPLSEETAEKYLEALEPTEKKQTGVPTFRQIMDGTLYMIKEMDSESMAEAFSSSLRLTGEAEKYVSTEYGKLGEILEENRESGRAASFFVPCSRDFFALFSRWIPLACTLESILAGVLLMMQSVSETFATGTAAVVYTTKAGRKIQDSRRRTAASAGVLFTICIWGVTLMTACVVFPLGSLWKTPVGSMMLLDSFFPILSRIPLTAAGYVGIEFMISIAAALLFSYISFSLVTRNKNSFVSFIQLGFGCTVIYTVTSLFPKNSRFYFILQYNPVDLARKAGHWMVSGGHFFSPRYYEVIVLLCWGGLAGAAAFAARKKFLAEDL